MLAILLFGIFVVQFRPLQPSTISPNNLNTHVCMQRDGTMTCCTSYYQTQDGCLPCIGAIGPNCSISCPPNYFGAKCMDRCQCSTDECDKELGCYKDYQTTADDDDTETQPPSTLHRNLNDDSFPKESLLVWIRVICGTLVTILLFLIIVFLLKSRNKRKQKRQQNVKFSSTIEINNSIDDINKSASCADYINTSFQPKLGNSGHI
ncbi:uncharacterized protein LOC111137598 isoform X4 [Crassostrea virginica]